jgi:hypothetical protein
MCPTFLSKVTPLSLEAGGTYPDILKKAMSVSSRAARSRDLLIMEHEGNTLLRKSGYVQLRITQRNVPEDQKSQLYK